MSFGTTPTTSSQGALSANQVPISSVAEPGRSGGDLTATEGGPGSTDSNGNRLAPVSTYVKDGNDLAEGAKADSAATDSTSSWSVIALLKGLYASLATLAGGISSSKYQSNIAQLAGTTTDTNSGSKSAGTLRVVLATDQPALTNKLLVTPDSVALPANQSVNISQMNGVTTTMGNGVSGTGVQRVTIASDSTGQVALAAGSAVIGHVIADSGSTTAVTQATASNLNAQVVGAAASGASQSGNPVKVGAVFNTTQPTVTNGQAVDIQATARGAQIVATGADTFTTSAAQSGTWTVQPGNTANTTAWLVQPVVGTTGGATPYHLVSAATTNANNVKSSAGTLYGYTLSNTNASARYFRLYNLSGSPTVGSSTIKHTVQIPGNATVIRVFPNGLAFGTGIAISCTGAMADADATAISAGDVSIDLDYD